MIGPPAPTALPPLAEHPFFQGLPGDLVSALAPAARTLALAPGEYLVREGQPATAFFLLVEGKVALEIVAPDLPHRTIQTLGPGDVLGWSWLISPNRWHLDARAVKPTRAWALDAHALRATLDSRPGDGYRFLLRLLPVIASRLENTRIQLLDLHGR